MVPLATPCLSFSMSHLFLSLMIASATTRTSYSHVMRNNNRQQTAQLRHLLLGIPMSRLASSRAFSATLDSDIIAYS